MPTVPVRYLAQDKIDFCGPACVQMLLCDAFIPAPPPSQADLHLNECKNKESGWSSTPCGIQSTLADRLGQAIFGIESAPDPLGAGKLIVSAIDSGSPALVLTGGNDHWIVVTGYRAAMGSGDPALLDAANPGIDAYFVNDPFMGNFTTQLHTQNEVVPWDRWVSHYQTGPVGGDGDPCTALYAGKYLSLTKQRSVAVCVEAFPSLDDVDDGGILDRPELEPAFPPGFDKPRRPDDEIVAAAIAGVMPYLEDLRIPAGAIKNASYEIPAPLVAIDRSETRTDLVLFRDPEDRARIVLAALVDDESGRFAGARSAPDGSLYPNGFLDFETAVKIAAEQMRADPIDRERPRLVWRMCRQSTSPYLPFYFFESRTGRAYVRVDGVPFPKLEEARGD